MKPFMLILPVLIFAGHAVHCQKLFAVFHDNTANVIQRPSKTHFVINRERGTLELPRDQAKVFLKDIPLYLPGYILVEDESTTDMDTDEQNRKVGSTFFFRYHAKITPNRELTNPYVVLQWLRDDKSSFIDAIPIDNLVADEPSQVSFSIYVPDRYRLIEPTIHYMCMGFELGTSKSIEKPPTPYAFALQNAGETPLADGNIKPIQMIPTQPIMDAAGNKREGSAHLLMQIDELGYVRKIEVRDYTEWIFAKTALMDAPFFLFQPKIKAGKPVATQVVVPFKF